MKRLSKLFITMLFASVLLFTVTACGKGEEKVEGKLTDLMDKVNSEVAEEFKQNLFTMEINEENIVQFLGSADIEFEEAVASENMIGSIAHSVILLRAKENADIEALKTQIKGSINPRKWICVGVEPEDVIIENKGNLIIVIVIEDENIRNSISKEFKSL